MAKTRRITANLPAGLLEEAMETTGKGITDTLIEGLELVRRTRAYRKAMSRVSVRLVTDTEPTSRDRAFARIARHVPLRLARPD